MRGGITNQTRFPTIKNHSLLGEQATSEGEAVKSTEGSACISFASSRIRRTPGDLVLRAMYLMVCAVISDGQ